jgi:hypothetical protein
MKFKCAALVLILALTGCSSWFSDKKTEDTYPQTPHDIRKSRNGSLTGDGGWTLLGGKGDEAAAAGSPIGVNSFLWRATLDTLSFMPLVSADPFGGVIITDWYEDPKTPGMRFKVNALILDRTLRADGVRITVFKQQGDKRGGWREQQVDEKLAHSLEDTVLTRARQLKMTQGGK